MLEPQLSRTSVSSLPTAALKALASWKLTPSRMIDGMRDHKAPVTSCRCPQKPAASYVRANRPVEGVLMYVFSDSSARVTGVAG